MGPQDARTVGHTCIGYRETGVFTGLGRSSRISRGAIGHRYVNIIRSCNPVPVKTEEKTINVISIECLQNAAANASAPKSKSPAKAKRTSGKKKAAHAANKVSKVK